MCVCVCVCVVYMLCISALSFKPGDPLALKRRAYVLGKQGKQQEAIADYKRAVEIEILKQGKK